MARASISNSSKTNFSEGIHAVESAGFYRVRANCDNAKACLKIHSRRGARQPCPSDTMPTCGSRTKRSVPLSLNPRCLQTARRLFRRQDCEASYDASHVHDGHRFHAVQRPIVRYHALECGTDGEARRPFRSDRRAGEVVSHVLVSALRLSPPRGPQSA
jgi:hypothetical protein